jgi:mono/diheme cytochrome c family protein
VLTTAGAFSLVLVTPIGLLAWILVLTAPQSVCAEETTLSSAEQRPSIEAASSIWEGVFTTAQARRGAAAYTGPCSRCHGYKLDGAADDPDMLPAPPVAGPKFLRKWDGRSLAALLDYLRATMPENNPSYLSDREYVDIIAYMLAVSGAPPGRAELGSDPGKLAWVSIRQAAQ